MNKEGHWIFNPKWGYIDDTTGYAVIRAPAHRLVYDIYVGKIPDDYVVHHKCNVHACVNPFHLEAITYQENAIRAFGKWTDKEIAEIRSLRREGYKLKAIGERYGMSTQYVSAICKGQYR